MTLFWFWQNREVLEYSLNKLYRATATSKQAFHQWLDRQLAKEEEWQYLRYMIKEIRENNPGMSVKKMYRTLKPGLFGRDTFFARSREEGLCLHVKRNPRITTRRIKEVRFKNLIKGLRRVECNKVWVSDITYYSMGNKTYYLTLIMDYKSKYIVGYSASTRLSTVRTVIPSLKMALKNHELAYKPIFHSDAGGQYYQRDFRKLTKNHGFRNSMTEAPSENNYAERINGTIKNEYLSWYMPTTFEELQRALSKAVKCYNYERPHNSLDGMTPAQVMGLAEHVHLPVLRNVQKQIKQQSLNKSMFNPSKVVNAI